MNRTILLFACDLGSIECVRVLLDTKNDMKLLFDSDSVLTGAGLSGNIELFTYLLDYIVDHGLQLNDSIILNCFQTLANTNRLDNIEITTRLLSHVKDVNFTQSRNFTHSSFLGLACGVGNCELVRILLERGADRNAEFQDDKGALCVAAHRAHLNVIKLMLEWKSGDKISINSINIALLAACKQGHIEVVRFLIERGANVNATDAHGHTPLTRAVGAPDDKYYDVSELLIVHGSDVNAVDREGDTMLIIASARHRADLGKLLLMHGADPNAVSPRKYSSLFFARASVPVMEVLVEGGADLNSPCTSSRTVLLYNVGSPDINSCYTLTCITWLLDHGADCNIGDLDTGETPLLLAVLYSRPDLVNILLDHGADVNLANTNTGDTPLMTAALSHRTDLVQPLLERGADVTQVNNAGQGVFDMLKGQNYSNRIWKLCEEYLECNQQGTKPLFK